MARQVGAEMRSFAYEMARQVGAEMRSCAECRYWSNEKTECRYSPPIIIDLHSCWPRTSCDDWCGKFEPLRQVPDITFLRRSPMPKSSLESR